MRKNIGLNLGGMSRSKANPPLGSSVPIVVTPETGLVAWWDFESGYDDPSEYPNGTYSWITSGTPSLVAGKVGNAAGVVSGSFNLDTDDFDEPLSGSNPWTVSFWFKDISTSSEVLINKFAGSGDGMILFNDVFSNAFIFRVFSGGPVVYNFSASYAPLGSDWHFLALSYNPSGGAVVYGLWIDGNKTAAADLSNNQIPLNTSPFRLMALDFSTVSKFDSFCIFDKALSDDEVATLYNSGSGHNYASWSAL